MNSPLTKDLKVACYDLQMARATEAVETIREAAFCLEDMLQAVCSEKKYRFSFNPTPVTVSFGHRMSSGKPVSIAIKYQEPLTQTKARQLELKRVEEEKL